MDRIAALKENKLLIYKKMQLLEKKISHIDEEINRIYTFREKVIDSLRNQREKAYRRRNQYRISVNENLMLDVYRTQKERVEALTLATQSEYWNYTQKYRVVKV